MAPSCCPHSHGDHMHVLDEMGAAVSTRCDVCGPDDGSRAELVKLEPDAPRVWLLRGGERNSHGISARRPALSHTRDLSELPCAACVHERWRRRRSGTGSNIRRKLARPKPRVIA